MKLDFYYFSDQCPLNHLIIQRLDAYKDKLDIRCHDIANDFGTAKAQKIFFPTLTVLDGQKRYYSPIGRRFLDQAASGMYPEEKPYLPILSDHVITKQIEPLTADKMALACGCCGNTAQASWRKKARFLMTRMAAPYGFLHKDEDGRLLGGAEYLPSVLVPYDIPRSRKTAFITCVYLSDSEYDYKSAPLQALERSLCGPYTRVLAITDETGVFPNGDLRFFLRNGYRDEGIIFEDPSYCSLHLVSKQLTQETGGLREA